ncbi:unnamed protein product [Clonostachys rosea f. rosea IK726]|uniref:Uncharacterized protein n=1 Tax=Clonostachys rosea f. rosea IK726 TaxID=1349383 RepID=A0ACA9UPX5_BIOOC|nr:unnamed protein product [Clonostachys rosea f. rosea IK726]
MLEVPPTLDQQAFNTTSLSTGSWITAHTMITCVQKIYHDQFEYSASLFQSQMMPNCGYA